jgi:hypothetical protein
VSTAENIAKVVADLNAGRVLLPRDLRDEPGREIAGYAAILIENPVVIDATPIHRSISDDDAPYRLYEDHPCIAPPFDEFDVCFVNKFENVLVAHCRVAPNDLIDDRWETASPIDWDRVRWRLTCNLYTGGRTTTENRPVTTLGPIYLWRIAIYDDGEPADISWMDLSPSHSGALANFQVEMLVLLRTLNFLNATNVDVTEPVRPRAERRRIERVGEGVKVQTIHVYPAGPLRRGAKGTPLGEGTGEFSPTRGHFAHYGEKYNRGLLFGKYSGKFWHPPRVRVKGDDAPPVDYEVHSG